MNWFIFRLTLLASYLLILFESFAQSPHFREHTLPAEFRNTIILKIQQDKNGFMWLATNNGLIRFDGISYKQFVQDSLHRTPITALFENKHGLWIGYEDGKLGLLKDERFVKTSLRGQLPSAEINAIAEDEKGQLWFSSYGEGLFMIADDSIYRFDERHGLNDVFAYSIATDAKGQIWAGTDNGIAICSFDNGEVKITQLTVADGLPDNIVTTLSNGKQGMIVGMESRGVCIIDPRTKHIEHITPQWTFGSVKTIAEWTDDLWVGTALKGIIEVGLNNQPLTEITIDQSGKLSRTHQLMIDNERNLWVVSGTRTLKSTNRTFTFYRFPSLGEANGVQAVLASKNGELWFSTRSQLYMLPVENGDVPTPVKQFANLNIISLFEDESSRLWIGTFDNGLYCYEPKTGRITRYTEQNGIVNNNILSIAGKGSTIWIATLGGVSKIETGSGFRVENFTTESGLGSNFIYKVFIDRQDRVWFGTDGRGVTLLNDGVFKNFSLQDGLKSNIVYCITEDIRGQIWISTSNTGIYRFTGKGFQSFSPHSGLRDLNIASLVADPKNNLLVVSRQSIDVLNPKTGNIFYHSQEMGIGEIDPNINNHTQDDAGNIWLGTQFGLIRYNVSNTFQEWPVTRINKMLVYLSDNVTDTTANLAHDQNHISFDYIGFWYHDPQEVSYRIKLEGYDREWTDSRNRFVTYPSLPPGEYTFKVESSATSYFKGAPTISYQFQIHPPFYSTPWFYTVCVTITGIALFVFIKRRERNLKLREKMEKEKINFQFQTLKSQVNPHFLFNSFNTLIAVIEQDQETAVEYVEKLSDFYRNILQYREQDVISLEKELALIDDYYFLQLKRYRNNFTLTVNIPDAYKHAQIPPLTLQLLIENAVKHNIISKEKPLHVDVVVQKDFIAVRNNLQRKMEYERSTGVGLSNIISRFRLLTTREVEISETDSHFTVMVPILM
ncbi:MAG TPA: two-component regulator propeller domain-containing protein [Chryseosolibacter sp.]|nr:two-component regulator propeller domain-containing protein [Chryseosolibacter sp.]